MDSNSESTDVDGKNSDAGAESQSLKSSSSSISSSGGSSSSDEDESSVSDSEIEIPKRKVVISGDPGAFLRGFENHGAGRPGKRKRVRNMREIVESPAARRQKRDYSDSDNSYQAVKVRSRNKPAKTVDLEDVANGPLCNKLLFANLDEEQISELIGLATHYSRQEPPINLSQRQEENESILQEYGLSFTRQSKKSGQENPLLGLPNIPLPPSHLSYLSKAALSVPEFNEQLEQVFGDSALVAIGMFLEEMITASLLPLAGYHVLRCREIEELSTDPSEVRNGLESGCDDSDVRLLLHPITGESMGSHEVCVNRNEKPHIEWTLPPEEAMMKLLKQNVIPNDGLKLLPSPTRSVTPPQGESGQLAPTEWQIIQEWSKWQNLEPYFVVKHMDIYRLFLKMTKYQTDMKARCFN
eukprot:scaffold2595_cov107-Cylindrotheca_fusiformis.AAC.4